MKTLSIIIPAYGDSEYLWDTLNSLYSSNFEYVTDLLVKVVIIDNGITESTVKSGAVDSRQCFF